MERRQDDFQTTGEPLVVTTLRVSRAKLERLREIAAAEHRTYSQEIRVLIDERIAAADMKQAA